MKQTIKPVWRSSIDGVDVWESEDEIGYIDNPNDVRPSSARWVKKEVRS